MEAYTFKKAVEQRLQKYRDEAEAAAKSELKATVPADLHPDIGVIHRADGTFGYYIHLNNRMIPGDVKHLTALLKLAGKNNG